MFEKPIIKIKNIKQKLINLLVLGIVFFFLVFVATSIWIGHDAKKVCRGAKNKYGGDCVEALISLLNNEDENFRNRNLAVWALGQFGDSRALLTLQSYYTGNIPPRESLSKSISQYELKKAINLTSGGINITSFIWRHDL